MRVSANKKDGFTLIELLVVFSIIAILSIGSIASFNSFNNSQLSDSAVADVVNLLNTAKSRALSQVKPQDCLNKTLKGYEVAIILPNQYKLDVLCDNSIYQIGDIKNLAKNIIFTSNPTTIFNVSTGTVDQPTMINITGYGKNKQITTSSTGIVSVQ